MRTLKIIEHMSLDGVMQNSRDDNDFPYGDWTASYRTPAGREMVMAIHGERFDLVLGRRTYDLWSGFWPTAPSSPIGARINAATKYVATHRPDSLAWGPFEAIGPSVVEGVRRIKSQDGPNLILSGSSSLTSTGMRPPKPLPGSGRPQTRRGSTSVRLRPCVIWPTAPSPSWAGWISG